MRSCLDNPWEGVGAASRNLLLLPLAYGGAPRLDLGVFGRVDHAVLPGQSLGGCGCHIMFGASTGKRNSRARRMIMSASNSYHSKAVLLEGLALPNERLPNPWVRVLGGGLASTAHSSMNYLQNSDDHGVAE